MMAENKDDCFLVNSKMRG